MLAKWQQCFSHFPLTIDHSFAKCLCKFWCEILTLCIAINPIFIGCINTKCIILAILHIFICKFYIESSMFLQWILHWHATYYFIKYKFVVAIWIYNFSTFIFHILFYFYRFQGRSHYSVNIRAWNKIIWGCVATKYYCNNTKFNISEYDRIK